MQSRIEVELLDGLLAHYAFYTFINKVAHGAARQSGQVGVAVHINAVEQRKLEARNDGACVQVVLHQAFGNDDVAHLQSVGQSTCRANEKQVGDGELLY